MISFGDLTAPTERWANSIRKSSPSAYLTFCWTWPICKCCYTCPSFSTPCLWWVIWFISRREWWAGRGHDQRMPIYLSCPCSSAREERPAGFTRQIPFFLFFSPSASLYSRAEVLKETLSAAYHQGFSATSYRLNICKLEICTMNDSLGFCA